MGDNLKVALVEFLTLSQAVFVMNVTTWHGQAHPYLELKTQPRFRPVSLSLSLIESLRENLNLILG